MCDLCFCLKHHGIVSIHKVTQRLILHITIEKILEWYKSNKIEINKQWNIFHYFPKILFYDIGTHLNSLYDAMQMYRFNMLHKTIRCERLYEKL